MTKYRIVITIPADACSPDQLRDLIESEGVIIESMYELGARDE